MLKIKLKLDNSAVKTEEKQKNMKPLLESSDVELYGDISARDFSGRVVEAVNVNKNSTRDDVLRCLGKEARTAEDLAVLLSRPAGELLEEMAGLAKALTVRHFGSTISLYVPLYLSNYCSGGCEYCGFASDRKEPRRKMSFDEAEAEMDGIAAMGFDEILLLTGERTPQAGFEYLKHCVSLAAAKFHQVIIETFPMTQDEYAGLVAAGCTGLTIYQETYDIDTYRKVHRWGPKKDFANRFNTPFRALSAGMRVAGLGVLLGLADPVKEAVSLFLHLDFLRKKFWRAGFSVSFPRIRPQSGGYVPAWPVDERFMAQLIFAFRICLPDVPLVLSTRETPEFRDGMAGVGISKMSAASKTTVGGYNKSGKTSGHAQFSVCDSRDVATFCDMLRTKGLEPVFKNWESVYR